MSISILFQRTKQSFLLKLSLPSAKKNGGGERNRTGDLLLAKQALYQLSYTPLTFTMVGRGGLEPPTSRLSSARSNQLSYQPIQI